MTIEVFLKPKTLIEYLELAHKSEWTARIDINAFDFYKQKWSIYLVGGELIWCDGGEHWRRRWRRLMYQYCPHLSFENPSSENTYADYYRLRQWVDQGLLMLVQAKAIIQSNFAEVLFDILQQETKAGLAFKILKIGKLTTSLPFIDFKLTVNHSQENWKQWCLAGLEQLSPNSVPALLPHQQKKFLHQINLKLYRELLGVIDGEKTLRDVSLLLRQPLLYVALSLNSYFCQGSLQMYGIIDLSMSDSFSPLSPNFNISIEDLLSSEGVVCSNCGCSSNSITASLCQKCNSPLATKALPMMPARSISFKSLVSILLLLLMAVGGYFVWQNWMWGSIQKTSVPLIYKTSKSNCID